MKRIDDEESEDEGHQQEAEHDRDAIANQLFDGGSGDVSVPFIEMPCAFPFHKNFHCYTIHAYPY